MLLGNVLSFSSLRADDFFVTHHVMMHILFLYEMYDFLSTTCYCWCTSDINLGLAVITCSFQSYSEAKQPSTT